MTQSLFHAVAVALVLAGAPKPQPQPKPVQLPADLAKFIDQTQVKL